MRLRKKTAAPQPEEEPQTMNEENRPKTRREKRAAKRDFRLKLETCNATAWKSGKAYLQTTKAHVVFMQETHLRENDSIDEASAWAKARGWKSLWVPAAEGAIAEAGDASCRGGVAIFARNFLGLGPIKKSGAGKGEENEEHCLVEGRLLGAEVLIPGGKKFAAYSVYLQTAEGLKAFNKGILAKMAESIGNHDLEWIAAGDWNMEPATLQSSNFCGLLGCKIRAPETPTCLGSTPAVLDYFVVSPGFGQAAAETTATRAAEIRPHLVATMEFRDQLENIEVERVRLAKVYNADLPFGPRPAPQEDWEKTREITARALQEADEGEPESEVRGALRYAYAAFMGNFEREVAHQTGAEFPDEPSWGLREVVVKGPLLQKEGGRAEHHATLGNRLVQARQELMRLAVFLEQGKIEIFLEEAASFPEPPLRQEVGRSTLQKYLGEASAEKQEKIRDEAWRQLRSASSVVKHAAREIRGTQPDDLEGQAAKKAGLLKMVAKAAQKKADEQKKHDAKESNAEWQAWKEEEIAGAAGKAFSFARLPERWKPPTAKKADGGIADTPVDILEAEDENYAGLWRAEREAPSEETKEPPRVLPQSQRLKRPTVQRVRKACGKFKKGTAIHPADGVRMKHFLLLPDLAVEALIDIFMLMEAVGEFPGQAGLVLTKLLPKPRGGTRPIGIYPCIYRVWARTRQIEAARWEKRTWKPFYAAAAGTSPEKVVWRAALRNQAAKKQGQAVAQIVVDFKKFYEMVDHEVLEDRAKKLAFPEPLLRLILEGYRLERRVGFENLVGKPLFAKSGIIAGDTFATALVKAFYAEQLESFQERWREIGGKAGVEVELAAYIDDLSVTVRGPAAAVTRMMPELEADLVHTMEAHIGGKIAGEKTNLTASTRKLWREINQRRETQSRQKEPEDGTFLGIDTLMSRSRGAAARGQSKWRNRFAAAMRRRKRLQRLKTAQGKSRKIFSGSLQASLSYGSCVLGTSDAELLSIRKAASTVLTPKAFGRSLSVLLAVWGDPCWLPAVSPILRWGEEIFEACREIGVGTLSRRELEDIWQKCPPESAAKTWRRATGPMDALYLSLKRIGWKPASPTKFVLDIGGEVELDQTPPRLLKRLLQEAVERAHQRKAAANLFQDGEKRVCFDHVRAACRQKRKPDFFWSGLTAVCGATWTGDRLEEAGYIVDADAVKCSLCKKERDTLQHRLWFCEASAKARDSVFKKHRHEVVAARAAGKDDPLYTRALVKHPAAGFLPPLEGGIEWLFPAAGAAADGTTDSSIGGHLGFLDGSCDTHIIRECRRAGWSVVFTDACGKPSAVVRGPVWHPLPQTAAAAEYVSYGVAAQVVEKPTKLYGDCESVVKAVEVLAENLEEKRRESEEPTTAEAPRQLSGELAMGQPSRRAAGEEPFSKETLADRTLLGQPCHFGSRCGGVTTKKTPLMNEGFPCDPEDGAAAAKSAEAREVRNPGPCDKGARRDDPLPAAALMSEGCCPASLPDGPRRAGVEVAALPSEGRGGPANSMQKYAAVIEFPWQSAEGATNAKLITGLEWMRAHQSLEEADLEMLNEEERAKRLGNDEADRMAKTAAEEAREATTKQIDTTQFQTAMRVWKLMVSCLGLWPALSRSLFRQQAKAKTKLIVGHEWVRGSWRWRCRGCGASTRGATVPEDRAGESCTGLKLKKAIAKAEMRRHEVRSRFYEGAPLLFCARCGAKTTSGKEKRGSRWASACASCPTSVFAKTAVSRMLSGRHPVTKLQFDGYGPFRPRESVGASAGKKHPVIRRLRGKQPPSSLRQRRAQPLQTPQAGAAAFTPAPAQGDTRASRTQQAEPPGDAQEVAPAEGPPQVSDTGAEDRWSHLPPRLAALARRVAAKEAR